MAITVPPIHVLCSYWYILGPFGVNMEENCIQFIGIFRSSLKGILPPSYRDEFHPVSKVSYLPASVMNSIQSQRYPTSQLP